MTSLSDPLDLGRGPVMANRFMLAPLTNLQSHDDGTLSDDEHRWLTMRAAGGFGATMTCAAYVQQGGKAFPGQLGISSDAHLPGLARLARDIAATGSVSSVQLHHGGERARRELSGEDLVAPWDGGEFGTRAMTTAEVEGSIEAFIAAAVRAEKAGFHGVELHGAHSYLLCEFLNAEKNLRGDRYGGSYENRTRMLREIIDGVRAATGSGFHLGVRLSPERHGMGLAEAMRLAEEIMTGGQVDYLDMSLWNCFKPPVEAEHAGRPLIDWFTGLERGTCRLGVAGKLMSTATAQACLDHGADFVLIGRGAMLHHDYPRRALADAGFQTIALPVTRDYLRAEGLGEAFVQYVTSTWKTFVSD
ncbi:MAG: NADH:flavin oxidoreductase [Gammaproteobacteria bacterium]